VANILMNPVVPGVTGDLFASTTRSVSQQEGSSFAGFLEEKAAESDGSSNMFGLKRDLPIDHQGSSVKKDLGGDEAPPSIAGLLEQFITKLNELAENKDVGAGEWQINGLDLQPLSKLLEKAGMAELDGAALVSKTDDGGTSLGLVELLSSLAKNFGQYDQPQEVKALETSLPLLETFLSRLGVSESDIVKISEASVDDLGGFDLNIFLDGLNSIETPVVTENLPQGQGQELVVPLTDWQVEQLQDMLATAGMTKETEIKLFPEKAVEIFQGVNAPNETFDNPDTTVQMGLDRLKSMLQQTINDSESAQPKVDLPAFLVELKNVLVQADFKDGGVGWSPVVQNSIDSVFKELQKMVDFSQIKLESRAGEYLTIFDENLGASSKDAAAVDAQQLSTTVGRVVENEASSAMLSGPEKINKNQLSTGVPQPVVVDKATVENRVVTQIGPEAAPQEPTVKLSGGNETNLNTVTAGAVGENIEKDFSTLRKDSQKIDEASVDSKVVFSNSENSKVVNEIAKAGGDLSKNSSQKDLNQEPNFIMPHHLVDETQNVDITKVDNKSHPATKPPLQQLTFEQISTGVLRGLKESQRHLTMTLHPKELGEVKVDMMLRDNHVSLSFLMDTPKVKEILESSMQEFRQNMSQNGFELGQCSVSVNQDNDSQLANHQFAAGGHTMNEQTRKVGLAEINDIVAAGQKLRASYHDGQISVIA